MRYLAVFHSETENIKAQLGAMVRAARNDFGEASQEAEIYQKAAAASDDDSGRVGDLLKQLSDLHATLRPGPPGRLLLVAGGSIGRHEFCALDSDLDLLPVDCAAPSAEAAFSFVDVDEYCRALKKGGEEAGNELFRKIGIQRAWTCRDVSVATIPAGQTGKDRSFYRACDLFEAVGEDYEPAWASGLRGLVILDGVLLGDAFDEDSGGHAAVGVRHPTRMAECLLGLEGDLRVGVFPLRFYFFLKDQADSQALAEFLRAGDDRSLSLAMARFCSRRLLGGWVNQLLVHLLYWVGFLHFYAGASLEDERTETFLRNPYDCFRGGFLYKSAVSLKHLSDVIGSQASRAALRRQMKREGKANKIGELDEHMNAVLAQISVPAANLSAQRATGEVSDSLVSRLIYFWIFCDRIRHHDELAVSFEELKFLDRDFSSILGRAAAVSREFSELRLGLRDEVTFLRLVPGVLTAGAAS